MCTATNHHVIESGGRLLQPDHSFKRLTLDIFYKFLPRLNKHNYNSVSMKRVWPQPAFQASVHPDVWVTPTEYHVVGSDETQPISFSKVMSQGPKLQKGERLCSVCHSLGQLSSFLWINILTSRDVVVRHHKCLDHLILSALGGCHLCCLLLKAWEQYCQLLRDKNGQWVGKAKNTCVLLTGYIELSFRMERKLLRVTDVEINEVQISILCGNMPPEMGGQLICCPMICR